jgi:glutaminyl-peptide cyclotransferase
VKTPSTGVFKGKSRRLWLALGALALLAIAAGVLVRRDSGPTTSSAEASTASPAQCLTSNVRHLAIDRASAVREFAKPPAYTQGLVFADGQLFESTGQEGASTILRLDAQGGPATELARLDDSLFGEGLAKIGSRFYQLTWQAGLAFAYEYDPEKRRLKRVSTFHRDGEGWGLAASGDELVLSDGSARLAFVSSETFAIERVVPVRFGNEDVASLNELEFAKGEILANVYGDGHIVGIDPKNGCVHTVIDATRLLSDIDADLKAVPNPVCDAPCSPWDFVLNGIAFDPEKNEIYITGKNWPMIFIYSDLLD